MEMGTECVDLQILVELNVEVDRKAQAEIEAHGAERGRVVPVEEKPVDQRLPFGCGAIQLLPFRYRGAWGPACRPYAGMSPVR